ncbi:MAG: hypothetical protein AAFZ52_16510, partial [Bacteroidota bacterium]
MRILFFVAVFAASGFLAAQEAILTGILDGDLVNGNGQGGNPKAIELYVNGSLDLTGYQLSRTNNTNVFTFPSGSTYTDEFVYVINPAGETEFQNAFGTTGDFANVLTSTQIAGNGDDPYQLLDPSGTVLDQTGGPLGTGNNYRDGHRYRLSNTGPDGGWVEANWSGGNGTVDGQLVTDYASITMFGTYTVDPPGPSVSATPNGNLSEPSTNGGFTITLSQTAGAAVSVNYSLAGTASLGTDYTDALNGTVVIPMGQLSANIDLVTVDDNDAEPTETIELSLTGVSDNTFALGAGASITLGDDEPVGVTFIHTVQGNGFSSPLVNQVTTVEGIVVADFQGGSGVGLGGFFVQEEDADVDADAATSEGIWVFDEIAAVPVGLGDRVRVTGRGRQRLVHRLDDDLSVGIIRKELREPLEFIHPAS